MNETKPSGRFPAKIEHASPRARHAASKIAVLLINLGTPDATTYWPMRRYLKEFLSDRRVIETNRVLWWLILNGIVLVKHQLRLPTDPSCGRLSRERVGRHPKLISVYAIKVNARRQGAHNSIHHPDSIAGDEKRLSGQ